MQSERQILSERFQAAVNFPQNMQISGLIFKTG